LEDCRKEGEEGKGEEDEDSASKSRSGELSRDRVTGRRARESVDEVENRDAETLGSILQVFSRLVHAVREVHVSRPPVFPTLLDPCLLSLSLSAIPTFCNPAISAILSVQRNTPEQIEIR
jgi:hypothetical protein